MIFRCAERWQGAGFSFVRDEGTARLMDILIFGPLLIAMGAIADIPKPLKITLMAAGSFVIVWNGLGYLASRNEAMREELREQMTPKPQPEQESERAA